MIKGYIGYFSESPSAEVTSIGTTEALSLDTAEANGPRIFGPVEEGDYVDLGAGWLRGSSVSARALRLGLYIATSDTDGTPTGNPLHEEDIAIANDVFELRSTSTLFDLTPYVGEYLTWGATAVTSTVQVSRDVSFSGVVSSEVNPLGVTSTLPAPWAQTATDNTDRMIYWRVMNDGAAIIPPPVYDGSYTSQQFGFGDSGSLDLSGAWTGADTFEFIGLPPWMTQVGTTAVLNYVDASWGTEGNEAKNAIGDGVWDIQVAGVNAGGKTATSFWLRVGP